MEGTDVNNIMDIHNTIDLLLHIRLQSHHEYVSRSNHYRSAASPKSNYCLPVMLYVCPPTSYCWDAHLNPVPQNVITTIITT